MPAFKDCPACGATVAADRARCGCGHDFTAKPKASGKKKARPVAPPDARPRGGAWLALAALGALGVVGVWWVAKGSPEARSASEQAEATEPKAEPEPAPLPMAPASAPPRPPKLPARAAGVGWFCIKSMQSEHMSTCVRTRAACDLGRDRLRQSGLTYTPCVAQETAACFTFVNRLEQSESFDCSATIEACERQRAHGLAQKADVSDVSDCGPVK